MMGFVVKDFLVMRKNIYYYLFFMVFYGFMAATGTFPYSILAGVVVLVGLMLPMGSFSYDDVAKWEKFAAATPAGRRGVVQGKYLFALLGTAASTVLVGGILTVMSALGRVEVESWWEPLAVVGICACVTLLIDSVFLPLLLKYGAEKARVMSMVVFAIVFGGMALLALVVEGGGELRVVPVLPDLVITLAPVLLVVGTVAALGASYAVALRVYGRKEL